MDPNRPNLTQAAVGTTVVDSGMERTVHSHSAFEFPAERQQALEQLAQQRMAAAAAPAKPDANGRRQPTAFAQPVMPEQQPEGVTREQAAAAAYPFGNQQQAAPQSLNGTLPQGRVAARHNAQQQRVQQEEQQRVQQERQQQPRRPQQQPVGAIPPGFPQPQATQQMAPQEDPFRGVPTIPNTPPGFTASVSDGVSSVVDLPSRYAFYDFKELYVRPFVAFQLAKLSRAHEEQSLLPMVEAVSSVLSSPSVAPGVSIAHMLTVPDFYYVLYWLKMHSFSKGSYLHTTVCMNPEHMEWVQQGLKQKESLKVQELVTKSQLQITNLDVIPDMTQFNLGDDCEFVLHPATMVDTLSFLEHPQLRDPEFQWLARRASFIRHREYDLDFNERVEALKVFSADQTDTITKFEKICDSYGVKEKINVRCKECGASRVTRMTLDAHSFLSA